MSGIVLNSAYNSNKQHRRGPCLERVYRLRKTNFKQVINNQMIINVLSIDKKKYRVSEN